MSSRTKRFVRNGLVLLTALSCCAAVVSCSSSKRAAAADELAAIKARHKLVVATNPQYPPASYLSPDGKWRGFDIEVAQMIGDALGVEVSFLTPSWDVMTGGHWSGRWDLEVGSMDPTASRQKVLNFADPPYYYLPAIVGVRADSPIHSLSDLTRKTVGANGGTTYENYVEGSLELPAIPYNGTGRKVQSVFNGAKFKGYATDTGAIHDLAVGRLDAAIAAPTVFNSAIKAGQKVRLLEPSLFAEPLAIGADRAAKSSTLIDKVSALLTQWHNDGTMSRLATKWFGIDYSKPTP